jgi:hypothetical protein
MKSKKLRIWGARLEILGLVALLTGAFWQAKMSGWWEQQLPEWQALIQEDVNLTILSSLKDIANMETRKDLNDKKTIAEVIQTRTSRTIDRAISEREQKQKEVNRGQAAAFWSVRDFFMILGALLLVIGKIVSLQGMKLEA